MLTVIFNLLKEKSSHIISFIKVNLPLHKKFAPDIARGELDVQRTVAYLTLNLIFFQEPVAFSVLPLAL